MNVLQTGECGVVSLEARDDLVHIRIRLRHLRRGDCECEVFRLDNTGLWSPGHREKSSKAWQGKETQSSIHFRLSANNLHTEACRSEYPCAPALNAACGSQGRSTVTVPAAAVSRRKDSLDT